MNKRTSLIANLCIVAVLTGLGAVIFTTDLSSVFLSVGAPIYNGNAQRPNVSLLFNVYDSAHTRYIADIAQIFAEEDAAASFFISGTWVKDNMALTSNLAANHELGNYAFSNKDLKNMTQDAVLSELRATHELVKAVAGTDMTLFAPPWGSFSKKTLKAAESLGYTTIMWSKNTTDCTSADLVFNRATLNPKNGDLVLLLPTAYTTEALRDIIRYYKTANFNIVRVSENIK